MSEAFRDWLFNPGTSDESIRQVELVVGHQLPSAYAAFLRSHDGGEGFIGENYLILWRAAELLPFNREYEVARYAPGLLLFGSDGGGEGYGFDLRDTLFPVVRVPFVGMDLRYARPIAVSFDSLLKFLAK